MGVSSSIQETYRTTRHSFEFIHDAFLPLHYPKRAFNDFPLRDHLNSTVLGNLDRLNASHFALHIRRKARGYVSYTEPFQSFWSLKILSLPQSFPDPLTYTLNCDKSKIGVGMKRPYPSQKCYVLAKLKMARSGQGWERLKILLILLSVKIRSRGSSRQTFGAIELRSPIISTSRSLMSISNMAPAC